MSVAHEVGKIWLDTKDTRRIAYLIANHLKIDPSAVYNVKPPRPGRLTSSQTSHLRRALDALIKPKSSAADLRRASLHIQTVLAESEAP